MPTSKAEKGKGKGRGALPPFRDQRGEGQRDQQGPGGGYKGGGGGVSRKGTTVEKKCGLTNKNQTIPFGMAKAENGKF